MLRQPCSVFDSSKMLCSCIISDARVWPDMNQSGAEAYDRAAVPLFPSGIWAAFLKNHHPAKLLVLLFIPKDRLCIKCETNELLRTGGSASNQMYRICLLWLRPLTQDATFECYQPTGMDLSIFLRSSWQETLWHVRVRVHVFDSVFFIQIKLLLLQRAVKKPWLTLSAFCRSLIFYSSFQDDITIFEIGNSTA